MYTIYKRNNTIRYYVMFVYYLNVFDLKAKQFAAMFVCVHREGVHLYACGC